MAEKSIYIRPEINPYMPEVAIVQCDTSQIEYPYKDDKEKYGETNRKFCEAFNEAKEFTIVFTSPLYEDTIGNIETGSPASPSNGDLYYAVVVLADGQRMPYPLLEDAGGKVFKENEIKAYWEAFEKGEETPRVAASKDEFVNWIKQTYGEKQFAGVVEAYSGDQEDRGIALHAGRVKSLRKYTFNSLSPKQQSEDLSQEAKLSLGE